MAPKRSDGKAASKKPSANISFPSSVVGLRQCCWTIGLEKTFDGGASLGKEIGLTVAALPLRMSAQMVAKICTAAKKDGYKHPDMKRCWDAQKSGAGTHKNLRMAPAAQTWTSCIQRLESEIAPI
eukprot:206579-Amphidinium_carterae.1